MSEYWVSRKKYFCKYCEIYIADDAPSRQHHESGLRHQGNKERFVRGLYKTGEKRKKDLEEEKREMDRIGKAAQAAFAQDVGAGHAKASSSTSAPSTSAPPRKPPQKPSNPYTNYTTAEFLGYTDPDAERLKAEAERRRMQGVAGDWEVIDTSSSSRLAAADASADPTIEISENRKREAPPIEEDERQFRLRRKVLSTGLGEIYDPGIIQVKPKVLKPELAAESEIVPASLSAVTSETKALGLPKWTKVQWKRAGSEEDTAQADDVKPKEEQDAVSKREGSESMTKLEMDGDASVELKQEGSLSLPAEPGTKEEQVPVSLDETVPSGLFRKRKAPGGVANRGRRQI